MPERSESFLYVRVSQYGRTQVGGTFCRNDETLRDVYESIDPYKVQDIAVARTKVAEGEWTASEAGTQLDLADRTLRKVAQCLLRIEQGKCAVYTNQ